MTKTESEQDEPATENGEKAPPGRIFQACADRWGMSPHELALALKATIFKRKDKERPVSNGTIAAFLQLCHEYGKNPFLRQITPLIDKDGAVAVYMPIDGWADVVANHPKCDGIEFEEAWTEIDGVRRIDSVTSVIYRKDWKHPSRITEYYRENYRETTRWGDAPGERVKVDGTWDTMPVRRLRHKALMQNARYTFGMTGIHDEEEAREILKTEARTIDVEQQLPERSETAPARTVDELMQQARSKGNAQPERAKVRVPAEPRKMDQDVASALVDEMEQRERAMAKPSARDEDFVHENDVGREPARRAAAAQPAAKPKPADPERGPNAPLRTQVARVAAALREGEAGFDEVCSWVRSRADVAEDWGEGLDPDALATAAAGTLDRARYQDLLIDATGGLLAPGCAFEPTPEAEDAQGVDDAEEPAQGHTGSQGGDLFPGASERAAWD